MSYGPLPNLKLLLFYGFALPANPSDTVLFSFEVDRPLILSAALALDQAWECSVCMREEMMRHNCSDAKPFNTMYRCHTCVVPSVLEIMGWWPL